MMIKLVQTDILDPMFREGVTVTNPTHFLPKDPEKALADVKWTLYERLTVLRQCVVMADPDPVDLQMQNEMNFIQDLLDVIERSV